MIPGNQSPHDHVGRVWVFMCFQSYLIYLRTGLAATMAIVGKKGESAGGGAVAITQGRTNIRLRTHNVRVRAGTDLVVVSPTRNAAVFFAADTDSTSTLTIPEPRFAAVGNVSLGSISKGGSRITQNHASSRSRQSDGNPLLSSRSALYAFSDSLSRSSLAPSLSN